jgi:spore coat polysaccharide biosynthesis protein SpsF
MDRVIKIFLDEGCDYTSNTLNPTLPDGMDVEVFKFSALKKAFLEATLKSDREHVTPYIWRNSSFKGGNLFSSVNVANDVDFSSYRLTVDTEEDFIVIKMLVEALGTDKPWIDYVRYLDAHPEVRSKNSIFKRNEGYEKSLKEDNHIQK